MEEPKITFEPTTSRYTPKKYYRKLWKTRSGIALSLPGTFYNSRFFKDAIYVSVQLEDDKIVIRRA